MNNDESRTYLQMSLIYRFRDLWRQYILWTREFIINVACHFENSPFITLRMTQLALDFAYQFRQYYGYENARIFELLLKKQFLISVQIINAVKAGDTELSDVVRAEWYTNVDEIADFLSGINPHWSKEYWQQLIYEHLYMLEYEGTCEFMAKYNADLKNYEIIEDQSLIMGNYMAEGIIKQFFI